MRQGAGVMDLRPGDIGFGPLSGMARTAMWGQFILGEGFHVRDLQVGHVFIVTEAGRPNAYLWPRAVEAMPRGARDIPLTGDRWNLRYAYVRLAEDYAGQADDAAAIARAMIGTPYSFASYVALAAWRFGLKVGRLEDWIDRRQPAIEIPGSHPTLSARNEPIEAQLPQEAICSVLVDQAWSLAGKQIMHGVAHQCVTPGALAGRLLEMAATEDSAVWTFPR